MVHRDVRIAQHFVRTLLRLCTRDTDAGVQIDVLAFHLQRSAKCRGNAVRDVHHFAFTTRLLEQDREFVAAETRRSVTVTQTGPQAIRRLHQHRITGCMAERVVDFLEIVEVEEHNRHFIVRTFRARQPMCHAILEQRPVAKACQRIVQRLMAQMFFECHPFGHVTDREYDAVHVHVGEQVRRDGFRAHPLAIGADHPAADVTRGRAAHQRRGEMRFVRTAISFVHQFGERAIHHSVRRRAEHAFGGRADVADDAERIENREHVGRVLYERAETGLGLLGRLLDVEAHVLAHGRQLPRHHEARQDHRAEYQVGDAVRFAKCHHEQQTVAHRDREIRHDREAGAQLCAASARCDTARVGPAHAGTKPDHQVATDAQHVRHLRDGRRVAEAER